MRCYKNGILFLITTGILLSTAQGAADKRIHLYLLFGQSNMAGAATAEAQDRVTNPRVKVLAYNTCSALSRTYDNWYVASPPLHECWNGVGPGDYFGKMMADSLPSTDTIGLIPCAISGVDIAFFQKGVTSTRRSEFSIPPDNHWTGAYEWMIERCKLAQEYGVIEGIIFHQGESNSGQTDWVSKVKTIVNDLRTDLGIGENAPFVAGELLYSQYGGTCSGHNTQVNRIPDSIPNSYVASAANLTGQDQYHFNIAGQREFGKRYATLMLKALHSSTDVVQNGKVLNVTSLNSLPENATVYSLNGRLIAAGNHLDKLKKMNNGTIYLVSQKGSSNKTRLMVNYK